MQRGEVGQDPIRPPRGMNVAVDSADSVLADRLHWPAIGCDRSWPTSSRRPLSLKLQFICSMNRMGPRVDVRRKLFLRAQRQGGYFTAEQAVGLGLAHQAHAHHVAAGNWERVGRGLFRLADWADEPFDEFCRWSLWSKDRAVVSHESALTVHQIGEFESSKVHLTVPPRFTMSDPALTLHRAALDPADIAGGRGFRVTTPLRTVLDIAAGAPDPDQLERLIAEARERGMFTTGMLRKRAEEVDTRAALYVEHALNPSAR